MGTIEGRLPDWSSSQEPGHAPSYNQLTAIASAFVALDAAERRREIAQYAEKYCWPRFQLAEASGLYLLLRVAIELPTKAPREAVRVFGGWLHPSIDDSPTFDLSWPVRAQPGELLIEPFPGYFGKGYDALSEFDFFIAHFPYRNRDDLASLRVRAARR